MTSNVLRWTLQTALSDMYGASQGGSFEPRAGMSPPKAIGVLMFSHGNNSVPVFSDDQLGPDLSPIPFRDIDFWVQAHPVFSKVTILRQVQIAKLMVV